MQTLGININKNVYSATLVIYTLLLFTLILDVSMPMGSLKFLDGSWNRVNRSNIYGLYIAHIFYPFINYFVNVLTSK